jgi:hypothetical protein
LLQAAFDGRANEQGGSLRSRALETIGGRHGPSCTAEVIFSKDYLRAIRFDFSTSELEGTVSKLLVAVVVSGVLAVAAPSAHSQNLLTNGDFELGAPGPDFTDWDFFERVPSQPGAQINNLEQVTFGNPPADPGTPSPARLAWLRPFAGNQGEFMDQNVLSEAGISQTVPGMQGETYTFTGWSRFEPNYAGGLDTVDGNPSPTETTWNLDFLNSNGDVIGGATPFDVRADREDQSFLEIANDNQWYQHTLMATAPNGTASVRVTAGGYDMISNNTNTDIQSALFDVFSLTSTGSGELLSNPNLNIGAITPPELQGWTVVGTPATAGDQAGDFGDNPNTPGVVGYWVRAFLGSDVDATLSQRVAAAEGDEFNFSAWAAFGNQYSGGTSGSKPSTITLLEVAFLDAGESEIEATTLDLWDEGLRNARGPGTISEHPEAWEQFFINGQVAPAGTAFVEVRAIAENAFETVNPDQAAFFDDFVLELASAQLAGDYNDDGKVDAADYVVWRKNPNAHGGDPGGYNTWRTNFGEMEGVGSGNLLAGNVPEPSAWTLALVALIAGASIRRQSAN